MTQSTHYAPPRAALRGALVCASLLAPAVAGAQSAYHQTNLVSSVPGLAAHLDPQLVNPWGISFSPTSPFWVSDQGAGVSTLYNGAGVKQGLVVSIPGIGSDPGDPTGTVFNGTGAFPLNGSASRFLFAEESGIIAAWNGGTSASRMIDNSAAGASYTGLAIAGSGATARLFAANFGQGQIDVWDGNFTMQSGAGFTDPNLPAGYSPFNVQTIGSSVYVTYAPKDPITGDEIPGAGNGLVDVYDTSGNLLRRLVSNGALNDPWGVALAPSGFGVLGGSLLVGNFGDGTIHGYDPITGAFLGALLDLSGNPIQNDGLWGLAFGNGGPGFDPNTLYFTAGINGEEDGLFGAITATPEPSSIALLFGGLGVMALGTRRRRSA